MKPAHDADGIRLYQGDVLAVLAALPERSVNCVVTSPPYWSLRKYDAPDTIWGGDPDCPHTVKPSPAAEARVSQHQKQGATSQRKGRANVEAQRNEAWVKAEHHPQRHGDDGRASSVGLDGSSRTQAETRFGAVESATCPLCGAWRGQYGLESTPALYVEHTLMVLRAIRRVLRDDGVVWWNIGDGYNAAGRKGHGGRIGPKQQTNRASATGADEQRASAPSLKPKDLILMPERVALAAQADGWFVRSRIAWLKANPMPESVTDRPTQSWEHIWMLTKRATYWYDAEAVRETGAGRLDLGDMNVAARLNSGGPWPNGFKTELGRNLRSHWGIATQPMPLAHFATFPEAIPERCILASCPPEVCAVCGKARERIAKSRTVADNGVRTELPESPRRLSVHRDALRSEGADHDNPWAGHKTLGWTDCGHDAYAPGVVLDPFAGSGTTLVVARRLGRRAVGVELSPTYAKMAADRLALGIRGVEALARGQERLV